MNDNSAAGLLNVAPGPHLRVGGSLSRMQAMWIVALLPALVAGVVEFGWLALRVMGLAVGFGVVLDHLMARLLPSREGSPSWNSAVQGLLLAFLLPVTAPWWLVLVGCLLTIAVGKRLFGGWGGHPVNPVALAYAMLLVSWPERLDRTASVLWVSWSGSLVEPLRLVKTLGAEAEAVYDKLDLLLGQQAAGTGSGMILYLLLGGLLLVLLREIPWQIPLSFLAGVALCALLLGWVAPGQTGSWLFHILAGNTMLTAFFLAPEPTNSPVNCYPMMVYGLLGGFLLVLMRAFSLHIDGAVFAVLLINLVAPLLDRWAPAVAGLTGGEDNA